jgi:hypothetical protein
MIAPFNLEDRDWSNPADLKPSMNSAAIEEHADITQDTYRLVAEVLHITRPICHCKLKILDKFRNICS